MGGTVTAKAKYLNKHRALAFRVKHIPFASNPLAAALNIPGTECDGNAIESLFSQCSVHVIGHVQDFHRVFAYGNSMRPV